MAAKTSDFVPETRFSVLIPVYFKDCPILFEKALASIINNSMPPNQIVLVVDGPISSDLDNVILKYSDSTFCVIRLEKNEGIISALNKGLQHCVHDLVARCDADDINYHDRFELQIKQFIKIPELVLCGSQIEEKDGVRVRFKRVPVSGSDIFSYAKFRNPFNHMTVMFKKSVVQSLGGYPNIAFREDYALWVLMLANRYCVTNLDKITVTASGGMPMYKRRGRLKDFKHEIRLQRFFLEIDFISKRRFVTNLIIRGGNMLVGSYFRSLIYAYLLRSS